MEGRTRGPGSRHSRPRLPAPGLSTPDCPPTGSTRAEQPLALQTCPPESSRPSAARFLPEATALPAVTLHPPMPALRTPVPPPPSSPPRSSSLDQAQTHPSLHCLPGSCRHRTRGKPAELQGEPRPPASPHPVLHARTQSRLYHSQLGLSTWCPLATEEARAVLSHSARGACLRGSLRAPPLAPMLSSPAAPPASAPDLGVFAPLRLFCFSLCQEVLLYLLIPSPQCSVKGCVIRRDSRPPRSTLAGASLVQDRGGCSPGLGHPRAHSRIRAQATTGFLQRKRQLRPCLPPNSWCTEWAFNTNLLNENYQGKGWVWRGEREPQAEGS